MYFSITNDDKMIIVGIYVDDIIVISNHQENINWLNNELTKKFDSTSYNIQNNFSYLGMHISIDTNKIIISMKNYIKEIIKDHNGSKLITTPATKRLFEDNDHRNVLDHERKKLFHTTAAKLLYLSKRARPDILLTVSYLTNTIDEDLIIKSGNGNHLEGYVDASFGTHSDGYSYWSGSKTFW